MLALWLMAAALWCGTAMFGARRSAFRPSFWGNALITALILLGPAIEDSANGKSVVQASAFDSCSSRSRCTHGQPYGAGTLG